MKFDKTLIIIFLIVVGIIACDQNEFSSMELIPPSGMVVNVKADSIRFAAFGDYGNGSTNQAEVTKLVRSYNPDLIITLGDNNYPNGEESSLKENIGHFFCDYIYNFDATADLRCTGRATEERVNRFFPSPGNHDYKNPNRIIPYLNYFTLPGNEVFYDFIWGPVHFYSLDSYTNLEEQQNWLMTKLSNSEQVFNVVYFHHAPYSSGRHGNTRDMQWDFKGADLVLSGHDHIYERNIEIGNVFPIYIVNGLGGEDKRACNENPIDSDRFESFCYCDKHGSLIIDASSSTMSIKFISTQNEIIDSYVIQK